MLLNKLESELRATARERIAIGKLPCMAPERLWVGHGSRKLCALCDKVIRPDEVEYEVDDDLDGAILTYFFHMLCQSVWQLECARHDYLKRHVSAHLISAD
jgi:hypothetical protein